MSALNLCVMFKPLALYTDVNLNGFESLLITLTD